MTLISVVTPCYNEEGNVDELHDRIAAVFAQFPELDYEHIFVDNASKDGTVATIKALIARDPRVRLIVNVRNFGHIRSPYHGILQAHGDAVILMASDLQDPPELLPEFLRHWQSGYKVVLGVKTESEESAAMFALRTAYYHLIARLSDIELTKNNTGFGLYDREVVDWLRQIDDPYPYFRGLVSELGYESAKVTFRQPSRKRGITKNNFYTLYDIAMLGLTNHTKIPLRLATMTGFVVAFFSLLVAFGYLIAKLVLWNDFRAGSAPTVIGLFFIGSVQLIFTGLLGEYIGAIHTQILRRPLVVEKERVNFGPALTASAVVRAAPQIPHEVPQP